MTRLKYADEPGVVAVTLLHSWKRGQFRETAAPTFRNMALAIFNASPGVHRVLIVRSLGGVILFLAADRHGRLFDVEGRLVVEVQD